MVARDLPCRLAVFATRLVPRGRGKGKRLEAQGCGWFDWNADPRQERRHARLAGSGSFYWPGPRAAWRRALVLMRADETIQAIRIEGIGSQEVGYLRRAQVGPRFGSHPGQPELIARF